MSQHGKPCKLETTQDQENKVKYKMLCRTNVNPKEKINQRRKVKFGLI
jgi:hypothetical protein